MTKSKNFGRKIILVGIDSECLETYFKTKISKSKNFSITEFFLGLSHFLAKIVKKWKSQKILVENFFWSESIQNALECILKQKSQNQKFFRV